MLSFQKLLILAAILVIVWYGFKMYHRLQDGRRESARLSQAAENRRRRRRGESREPSVDMVQCPKCKAFVPAGTTCSCRGGR